MFRLILPDIGEGVVEAEIQQWFVKPGDAVVEDQPLVEVMTDKATVTIPSPRRGRVAKLLWDVGQIARVHDALLELELEGGASAANAQPHAPPATIPSPPAERGERGNVAPVQHGERNDHVRPRALAAPAVRAMARQLGVDIDAVEGTGPGGRVTKADLESTRQGVTRPTLHDVPDEPTLATPPAADDEIVPLRGIRRRIAERMAQSKRTAAHFTFVEQVDVTELKRVKDRIGEAAAEQGVHVTFLPFIVKAVVAALKRHPALNATLDEARGEIRLRKRYHLGIATATEQGLVVPVVRDADRRSLLDLAREIERLAAEARAGKLRPDDVGGSTFTITSLGSQGGLLATPVINFPEVAILGVHRIRPTPVVHDGQIVARDVMNVSLSSDHRVVDGHIAAAFAYEVVRYLEEPNLLFMQMV